MTVNRFHFPTLVRVVEFCMDETEIRMTLTVDSDLKQGTCRKAQVSDFSSTVAGINIILDAFKQTEH